MWHEGSYGGANQCLPVIMFAGVVIVVIKLTLSCGAGAGVRLDNRSCEVLEALLSRMQMATLDLQRTNLEDEVREGHDHVTTTVCVVGGKGVIVISVVVVKPA